MLRITLPGNALRYHRPRRLDRTRAFGHDTSKTTNADALHDLESQTYNLPPHQDQD